MVERMLGVAGKDDLHLAFLDCSFPRTTTQPSPGSAANQDARVTRTALDTAGSSASSALRVRVKTFVRRRITWTARPPLGTAQDVRSDCGDGQARVAMSSNTKASQTRAFRLPVAKEKSLVRDLVHDY